MKTIILTTVIALFSFVANPFSATAQSDNNLYFDVKENTQGKPIERTVYKESNGKDLSPVKKTCYIYNTQNKPVEKIEYKWDKLKKDWYESIKTAYKYDKTGCLEMLLVFNWNKRNNDWSQPTDCVLYTRDNEKKLLIVNHLKTDKLMTCVFKQE